VVIEAIKEYTKQKKLKQLLSIEEKQWKILFYQH
jgi:hypothetical protein